MYKSLGGYRLGSKGSMGGYPYRPQNGCFCPKRHAKDWGYFCAQPCVLDLRNPILYAAVVSRPPIPVLRDLMLKIGVMCILTTLRSPRHGCAQAAGADPDLVHMCWYVYVRMYISACGASRDARSGGSFEGIPGRFQPLEGCFSMVT